MAVAFANIFMASIVNKPLTWKRFIDDVFRLWDTNKEEIENSLSKQIRTTLYHKVYRWSLTIRNNILGYNSLYKGERFEKESILDVHTHYKPPETFHYTNYNSCHPAGFKKGFVKGEALRLLRTNSSKVVFEENVENFKTRLVSRGYPSNLVDKILSEVNLADRKNALTQKQKVFKKILPFVTQFQPSLPWTNGI